MKHIIYKVIIFRFVSDIQYFLHILKNIYIFLKPKNLYAKPKFLVCFAKKKHFMILVKILFWIIFTKQIIPIHSCKMYIYIFLKIKKIIEFIYDR